MWRAEKGSLGWCFCQARLRPGEKERKTQSHHLGEVAAGRGTAGREAGLVWVLLPSRWSCAEDAELTALSRLKSEAREIRLPAQLRCSHQGALAAVAVTANSDSNSEASPARYHGCQAFVTFQCWTDHLPLVQGKELRVTRSPHSHAGSLPISDVRLAEKAGWRPGGGAPQCGWDFYSPHGRNPGSWSL